MKNNTQFKIYRNNKLELNDAVAKELRFRAMLVGQVAKEIGKCILDDFTKG